MGQVPNKCIKNVKKHQLGSMNKLQTNVAPHNFFALVCQGRRPVPKNAMIFGGPHPPKAGKRKKGASVFKKTSKIPVHLLGS